MSEAAPVEGQLKKYRGWVPTISGRLSFSVFGDTYKPERTFRANVADDKCRFLAAYQYRDTSDALLLARGKLAPFLFGLDGRLFFVFLAKTEDTPLNKQHVLRGRGFIFRRGTSWSKEVLPAIKSYQDHLRRFQYFNDPSLEHYAKFQHSYALECCTKSCVFFADVAVSRTGTTDIHVPFPMPLPKTAPTLPSDEVKFGHIAHVLASQIFYFVKDLGHRHQHHDSATDQIVHLIDADGIDDRSWRERTLYGIYRRVIEIKRDPHMATFSDSLGLIAYAEAFSEISKEELKEAGPGGQGNENDGCRLPTYYAPQTIASITSARSRVERIFAIRQRRIDLIRNTVLSIAGLLLSFIGLLRLVNVSIQAEPHPHLVFLARSFAEEPYSAMVGLFLIVWAVVKVFTSTRTDPPLWSVRFTRLLQPGPRSLLVSLLILGMAATGALFFWLL